MHNKITVDWLRKQDACADAVKWAASRLNGGKTVGECIEGVERADWLIWLLWHSQTVNIQQLVKLACVAGRLSLRHIDPAENRPRLAYEAAEAWVDDPDVGAAWAAEVAAMAAWAAARAAEAAARATAGAAARAAWAATKAAWAAAWAAEAAAGSAARAATVAAWAAAEAAEAAARADEHHKMCNAIRVALAQPEFEDLTWPL